jgi:hypothetical protein
LICCPDPVNFERINTLLIYSPKGSNRLTYILKTLLGEGLGLAYQLTTNPDEFNAYGLPKINYSAQGFESGLQIKPQGILTDYGIKNYHLEVIQHEGFHKIFFKTGGTEVPFDVFGAAFWLLSRYEEYLPHKADQYNRFHYRSSLAYQYDFIHLPLVNIWLDALKELLAQRFPELGFNERAYRFISSIDIDNAYQYKFKGMVRTLAGFLADRSLDRIQQRFKIILNRQQDPFDCYDFLIAAHQEKQIKALYFLLLGDYGDNDKNHSSSNLHFQSLIKHLADYSAVGIHPSFGSINSLHQLKVETSRLGAITHRTITRSRQHFSMLRFPKTYQDLLQAGITDDYSMGYTNFNGFRASCCYPFGWYNLDNESPTPLQVHPFVLTENTLKDYAEKAGLSFLELAKPFIDRVKQHGGELVSIFHNDTFTEEMKKNYLDFLELAKA